MLGKVESMKMGSSNENIGCSERKDTSSSVAARGASIFGAFELNFGSVLADLYILW